MVLSFARTENSNIPKRKKDRHRTSGRCKHLGSSTRAFGAVAYSGIAKGTKKYGISKASTATMFVEQSSKVGTSFIVTGASVGPLS
jgi:hypothetical protein